MFSSTNTAERLCDDALAHLELLLLSDDLPVHDGEIPDRFWEKKCLHVALFSMLAVVLSRCVSGKPAAVRFFIGIAGVLVGILSESLQLLYPGREPSLRDVFLNAASATLTAFLVVRIARSRCHTPAPPVLCRAAARVRRAD